MRIRDSVVFYNSVYLVLDNFSLQFYDLQQAYIHIYSV